MSTGMPGPDSTRPFPRELVLASAGTGKTHALSNRIIGLLAACEDPDALLAATFTRKAAGEILNRVLIRLATAVLEPETGRKLKIESVLPSSREIEKAPDLDWAGVLARLLRSLHRIPIGTLDSFFIRVARSFAQELLLSPDWTIADEPSTERLRSQALQEAFAKGDQGQTVELVRMALRGETGRGLHRRLREDLEDLRSLQSQLDPGAESPWDPFTMKGDDGSPEPGTPSLVELADRLEASETPQTARGTPDKRFVEAIAAASARLREGDWEGFLSRGPPAKALDGSFRFAGKDLGKELRLVLDEALVLARVELRKKYRRQLASLKRLTESYQSALESFQREAGAYRFEDLTRLLGGSDPIGSRPDLWYRLDQWTRHLLLDEFQDTSFAQWDAIRPLAEEILAGYATERSLVLVADPKQSIYGWRGAEPELVHRVREFSGLPVRTLSDSYRSSGVVLGFVNRVFEKVAENTIWEDDPEAAAIAASWAGDFHTHRAVREIPGHVRIVVGPRDENMGRSDRPRMMAWVADQARTLQRTAPDRTIGILVRQNKTVARLTTELKGRGIEASEEGATALIDSPAAATILALLHMADHPGDTVAAYQVSRSPLGPVVGLPSFGKPPLTFSVALEVRASLLRDGYGKTLAGWAMSLGKTGSLSNRDHQRLLQLVELGSRWDAQSTLRPGDFVRFARAQSMDTPSEARVRVMTVHQAKGLEFDAVLLPELDTLLHRGVGRYRSALPERDPVSGRVVKIFPRVPEHLKPLFAPDMDRAFQQAREAALRDALGVVYVAMTRARYGLHLFLAADGGNRPPAPKRHPAWLFRAALGLEDVVLREGDVLLDEGDPRWPSLLPPRAEEASSSSVAGSRKTIPTFRLKTRKRRRFLPRESPSELTGSAGDDLAAALRLPNREATMRGRIVHAWLREVRWIEEGLPDREELLAVARREGSGMPSQFIEDLFSEFRAWMDEPQVRAALQRDSYPAGSRVETELPFATRVGARILHGQMDRVVLIQPEDRVMEGIILDFKTDQVAGTDPDILNAAVSQHRPQMDGYRKALRAMYELPEHSVSARLIFLRPGLVLDIDGA